MGVPDSTFATLNSGLGYKTPKENLEMGGISAGVKVGGFLFALFSF